MFVMNWENCCTAIVLRRSNEEQFFKQLIQLRPEPVVCEDQSTFRSKHGMGRAWCIQCNNEEATIK